MIESDEKVGKSIKIINTKDDEIMTLGQVAVILKSANKSLLIW